MSERREHDPGREAEIRRAVAAGALALLAGLTGCTVGPEVPRARAAPGHGLELQGIDASIFRMPTDGRSPARRTRCCAATGGRCFSEPELNALEDQLNINNQNIKQYFEQYMEARALIAEARSQYWPTITLNPVMEPIEEFRQPERILRRPIPDGPAPSGRAAGGILGSGPVRQDSE